MTSPDEAGMKTPKTTRKLKAIIGTTKESSYQVVERATASVTLSQFKKSVLTLISLGMAERSEAQITNQSKSFAS